MRATGIKLLRRWFGRTAAVSALLVFVGAAPSARASVDLPADGEAVVTLQEALRRPLAGGEERRVVLSLRLFRGGGRWQADVIGTAGDYTPGLYRGEVTAEQPDDRTLTLTATVTVTRGALAYGERGGSEGLATYEVTLRRPDAGRWAGTYQGRFRETDNGAPKEGGLAYELEGTATMAAAEAWPPVPGHKPVAPGEHPRLFFRKADLPALRERAKTDVGRKLIAQTEELLGRNAGGFTWGRGSTVGYPYTEGTHAAGHAFLFALTGDKAHADRAKQITFRAMAANGGEWGAWGNGLRAPGVAVAYDLCYDHWKQTDPAFLQQTAEWLQEAASGRGTVPQSHLDGFFHLGGGMAALAVLGDPAPAPAPPTKPADAAPLPPAPADFAPAAGVPVLPFADGQVAKAWLAAGGFTAGFGGDPLAHYGGPGKARPAPGERFAQGDATFEWQPVKTGAPRVDLYKFAPTARGGKSDARPPHAADGGLPVMAYLYAVLDNDRDRVVKPIPSDRGAFKGPAMPIPGVRMWVGGRELRQGDVVHLAPGKYPVMLELAHAEQMLILPKLVEYTDERYAADAAEHARELAAWERADRAMPHAAARLRYETYFVRAYADACYGDKGFFTEDSTQADAVYNLLPFLQAYRNVTGWDLTGAHPQLREVLPMIVLTRHRFLRHDWGTSHFRTLGFPVAVANEKYRALLRHEMDRALDPRGGDAAAAAGLVALPWDGMFALLNYPWDAEPRGRGEAGLPPVVEDRKFGGYVFTRNPGGGGGGAGGAGAAPEYQAIVIAQRNAPRSSVTATDVSLLVDGRLWMGYGNAGGGFFRPACLTDVEQPSVVRIDGAIPTRGAEVVAFTPIGDGGRDGGVVTLAQRYWVAGSADQPHSSPKIKDPRNLGITATRSVAVDYSGKCGAPVLVAIADRVQGAGDRAAWLQYRFVDAERKDGVAVDGTRFTIRGPKPRDPQTGRDLKDAPVTTLAGTVVAPAKAAVQHRGRMVEVRPDGAPGAAEQVFLTILTIQAPGAAAPAVVADAAGDGVGATVGGRSVRFDGRMLRLE